jgi:hypothetical protein
MSSGASLIRASGFNVSVHTDHALEEGQLALAEQRRVEQFRHSGSIQRLLATSSRRSRTSCKRATVAAIRSSQRRSSGGFRRSDGRIRCRHTLTVVDQAPPFNIICDISK